jgi:hypothetical protein
MSDTKSYNNRLDFEKRIKNPKKGKRFVDKYRKAVYNLSSNNEDLDYGSIDDYLEYEVTQNKTKLR